jgi:hypothetical protein
LVLSFFAVVASAQTSPEEPVDVPLVRLLSIPTDYDEKPIRTYGYLVLEFEQSALYLGRDDARAGILANALWLTGAKERFDSLGVSGSKRYVMIEGVFDAEDKGHMGMFSGAIRSIGRVAILPEETDDSPGSEDADATRAPN